MAGSYVIAIDHSSERTMRLGGAPGRRYERAFPPPAPSIAPHAAPVPSVRQVAQAGAGPSGAAAVAVAQAGQGEERRGQREEERRGRGGGLDGWGRCCYLEDGCSSSSSSSSPIMTARQRWRGGGSSSSSTGDEH